MSCDDELMSQELDLEATTDDELIDELIDNDFDASPILGKKSPKKMSKAIVIDDDSTTEEDVPPRPAKKSKKKDGTPKATLVRQDATVDLTHKLPSPVPVVDWPEAIADRKNQARLRNFVFTWNNYKAKDVTNLKTFANACLADNSKFYFCIGFEVGASGTKHLQGCCLLGKQVAFNALKKAPYPFTGCHMLVMRGTPKQASDYCKKDGSFWEAGTCPNTGNAKSARGARHDILGVVDKIKSGATDKMLLEQNPVETFKFLRNIRQVQSLIKPKRTVPLEVILCYGPPGAGKTHFADVKFPDHFRMPVSKDFWMDNYQQEKVVLLDDFNGEVKLTFLLQVLDKYPIQIPIKGGFVWWCPDTIILTCNTHPCNWYDYSARQDSYGALKRRFTKVLKFEAADYDANGFAVHKPHAETSAHNFFMFQKVIGKHCLDISTNMSDAALTELSKKPTDGGEESEDLGLIED